MTPAIATQIPFRSFAKTGKRAAATSRRIDWIVIALLVVHVPLSLLISTSIAVATIHAVLTVGIGFLLALQSRRHPERVAYVGAYVVGAEVLWRMTGAQVFWETGKYAIAAFFIIGLVLIRHRKVPAGALLYFALLLPSTLITVLSTSDFTQLHKALSFHLSGPFALAAAWCFFSQLQLSPHQLRRILLSVICPTVGVACVALAGTVSATRLSFTTESNFVTSGGFGPNQVAGALGLGALCALIWLVSHKEGWINRVVILGVLVLLTFQAALTFSRGGLYNAAGASAVAIFYLMRNRGSRTRVIMAVSMIALLAGLVIIPSLEDITGGTISQRFSSIDVAHRDAIVRSDLVLWQEEPILGVGLGMSGRGRRLPHTEGTRLLAEHGMFGLAAILALLIGALRSIRKARTPAGKAVAGSMVTFSLLFMLDKAMRLAAPSFAFGLAFAVLLPDQPALPRARRRIKRGSF